MPWSHFPQSPIDDFLAGANLEHRHSRLFRQSTFVGLAYARCDFYWR